MSKSRGFSAKREAKGFTLIELLITISIIAVLSAIGLVAYSTVLKQGRDSKRQSDLRSIQSALEQYYSDQSFYPFTSGSGKGMDDLLSESPPPAFTSSTGNQSSPPSPKTYMNFLPQNPTGTLRYKYEESPKSCYNAPGNWCTGYCLYAKLENSSPVLPAACTNASYNFAVTPP
ncbi:MAG: type II secretion system protein [Candidatus Daviesbacteria bacterium]|nr:type II secretion system protein [Candidatus Daviesbacteria bacterium]